MNKPFKTYNGGKGSDGTFQKIINHIPPHDIYIELFLGNGTIFCEKKPAQHSILIDTDTAVTQAWQKITVPSGTTILNTDAIAWLETAAPLLQILHSTGLKVVIYIDPPYLMETRKSDRNLYTHEMTTEQHITLLTALASIGNYANLLVSHYPCKLYNNTLKNFNNIEFQSQKRDGLATEKLWFNYPTPTQLHDYRYLGDNYRKRELTKKRIQRNASKLIQMPAAERNAIMELLNNEKQEL